MTEQEKLIVIVIGADLQDALQTGLHEFKGSDVSIRPVTAQSSLSGLNADGWMVSLAAMNKKDPRLNRQMLAADRCCRGRVKTRFSHTSYQIGTPL